jgi:hypothetical protein
MQSASVAILAAMTLALGCSGDENAVPTQDGGADAASEDASTSSEAQADAASEPPPTADVSTDGARADGFIDIFDAFPVPDGPLAGCATCVRDRCGMQVNACANDEACRAGLLCTLMTCLAMGGDAGPDLGCVTGCFMGNLGAAFTAIGSFTCINMNCGASCVPMADGGVPADVVGDGTVPQDVSDAANAPDVEASVESDASNDASAEDATTSD